MEGDDRTVGQITDEDADGPAVQLPLKPGDPLDLSIAHDHSHIHVFLLQRNMYPESLLGEVEVDGHVLTQKRVNLQAKRKEFEPLGNAFLFVVPRVELHPSILPDILNIMVTVIVSHEFGGTALKALLKSLMV